MMQRDYSSSPMSTPSWAIASSFSASSRGCIDDVEIVRKELIKFIQTGHYRNRNFLLFAYDDKASFYCKRAGNLASKVAATSITVI
ncbi:hypothetical protein, partial [Novipirellula maiorica]|uniref:hypothetical protein n=1 Tax=Novipirellula maiorica TaxID=1265734 RepID=UPI001F2A0CAB